MNKYEEIKRIIADADEAEVDFAECGNGISKEEIDYAEGYLGINFSPSYRWWLSNYGDGYIMGNAIYTVCGKDYDEIFKNNIMQAEEIVVNHLKKSKTKKIDGIWNKDRLEIYRETGKSFYFKINEIDEDGEHPIYELHSNKKYANDFISFLKRIITENFI